jgi:short subunit dehydrogenase-like uncharacterized protein
LGECRAGHSAPPIACRTSAPAVAVRPDVDDLRELVSTEMTMRIAVHGASGITGGLTLAEVRKRGLTPVLVGRNAQRLRKAAADAGVPDAEVRVADLDDPITPADALRDCDAVVNRAGPFTLWGEPVVRAAIAAGTHYVDTEGEQRYFRHILDT